MTEVSRIEMSPGGSTCYVGPEAVAVYQARVIAQAAGLLAVGIKPNRAYTKSAVLAKAGSILGRKFGPKDLLTAKLELIAWADIQADKLKGHAAD